MQKLGQNGGSWPKLGPNYAIILAEQWHDNDHCLHAAYFCNPVRAKLGHIWAKIMLYYWGWHPTIFGSRFRSTVIDTSKLEIVCQMHIFKVDVNIDKQAKFSIK